MAAHFCSETPARFECAMNTPDHRIWITIHPMQRSIGKHGVELGMEVDGGSIRHAGIDATPLCRRNHVWRSIHSHNFSSHRRDLFRERAIAAAQIKNSLAGLGIEQTKDGFS
jgi:hypothetical protein